MNLKKLKDLESEFLHRYPSGFKDESFFPQIQKFKPEKLELFAYKKLEHIRNVSRIAPMMGLIATLIPLGPALKSLTDGNIQGMQSKI